jgi:hypothetical protein
MVLSKSAMGKIQNKSERNTKIRAMGSEIMKESE